MYIKSYDDFYDLIEIFILQNEDPLLVITYLVICE